MQIVNLSCGDQVAQCKSYLATVVLPIVIIDSEGIPQPIGTASIVAVVDRQILILTAKHNIDHIRKVDQPYGDGTHPSMPDIFRRSLPNDYVTKNTQCYLVFPTKGECKYAAIHRAAYNPDFDIAIAGCVLPEGIDPPKPLAIDTDPPHIGITGLATGYGDMTARAYAGEDENSTHDRWEFEGKLLAEHCQVIEVSPHGSTVLRSPCFQINVPIHSGMSGGPVIHFLDHGTAAIYGLLTADESGNPSRPGESNGARALASALWISVSLSMPIERANRTTEEWTLLDLIRKGIVKNLGTVDFKLNRTRDGRIDVIPQVNNNAAE